MIGQLRGILIEKKPPVLLMDVVGVGYEVHAPMSTFYNLPALNSEFTLHIHMVVREDAHILYGFSNLRERDLFRTLIKVNGVGPKLGLAILSGMLPDAFVRCVMAQDTAGLVRLPGVGKKTAERLIVEVRDRLSSWQLGDGAVANVAGASTMDNNPVQDAISALEALGYKPQDAHRAITRIKGDNLDSEALIRMALKELC